MKKTLQLLTVLFLAFMVTGCSSDYMEERLISLEQDNKTLLEEKQTLETEKSALETTNDELVDAVALLETIKTELNDERTTMQTNIVTLEASITALETELLSAKSDDRILLETEISDLKVKISALNAAYDETYDGAILLVTGNTNTILPFRIRDNLSLFDLLDKSDLDMLYENSEYGHFINTIGTIESDIFHWVSMKLNGEAATSGVDTLIYKNGDIIEFNEVTIDWDTDFILTFDSISPFGSYHFKTTDDESVFISENDFSEEYTFLQGASYSISGMSEVGSKGWGWGCSNCIIPTTITPLFVSDFTEIYDLENGEEVFLEFTITELSSGALWGQEMFAEDSNGLLSKDITELLTSPYSSGYLFYTMATELDLVVGEKYVAKFTFDLYPPNSKGQLGLAGIDSYGVIDYSTVEFYRINENSEIIESIVTFVDTTPSPIGTCSGFSDILNNKTTGDQCQITFTVSNITWGTPSGIDLLGVNSNDLMSFMFDSSWGDAVLNTSYTVMVEKLSNNQIKLIGDLVETP